MREIDVHIELCVRNLVRRYGYSEDEAREMCKADLSNLKVK
jgi:hypothetical protein